MADKNIAELFIRKGAGLQHDLGLLLLDVPPAYLINCSISSGLRFDFIAL